MVDKELVKAISKRISDVCSNGVIRNAPLNFPSYTIHAYNRVIEEAGFVIGWTDNKNWIINFANLSSSLEQGIDFYFKAIEGMKNHGIDAYVIQQTSPVLIVETYFTKDLKNNLIPSLALSHIYSAIALLELNSCSEKVTI